MSAHRTALENRITRIIASISSKDEGMISPAMKLDDLGLESLDIVEIAVEMEAEFGFAVSDEDMAKLQTVADVFDLIDKHKRLN